MSKDHKPPREAVTQFTMSKDHKLPREAVAQFTLAPQGITCMTITPDGRLLPGEGLSTDEATQGMFRALQQMFAAHAPAARGGLEAVREALAWVDDNLAAAKSVMKKSVELGNGRANFAAHDAHKHLTTIRAALAAPAATGGETITARYTNWRGETTERTFIPHRVFFGSNEWHPEPQILIEATDCDKGALRTFAAAGFTHPAPSTGASAGVKVRALDWSPDGVIAETPFGAYSVGQTYDDKWTWTRTEYPYGFTSDPLPTEAEAKAAAQADFETRIRAALEGRSDG